MLTDAHAQGPRPRPTPACGESGVTPPQTPGPYFKPQSPLRTSLLEPGMPGSKIVVEGTVLTTDCKPVPRALVDFWQADAQGDYDNAGFRLRGHQFTDDAGRYRLETVVPGIYPGRTRHFHVNVQPPGRRVLTTQLYFPDEPLNQRDGIFDRELVLKVSDGGPGKLARFIFVL
jgi:protocatechuate 3,4-dioxygenase beta subunit